MDTITDYFNELSLNGFQNSECGSVTEGTGWHGRFELETSVEIDGETIQFAILNEDTQGFKDVEIFDTLQELDEVWSAYEEDEEADFSLPYNEAQFGEEIITK